MTHNRRLYIGLPPTLPRAVLIPNRLLLCVASNIEISEHKKTTSGKDVVLKQLAEKNQNNKNTKDAINETMKINSKNRQIRRV